MLDSTVSASRQTKLGLCVAAFASATLAGCAQLELTLPPLPDASADPAVTEADFPQLEPTAGRAQLGYDLRQARQIESELSADRANARYLGDAVRYETGALTVPPALPDPTRPIEERPLRPLPATAGPGDLVAQNPTDIAAAEEALEQRLAESTAEIETDESTLDDFLDDLGLGQAGPDPADETVELPIVAALEPDVSDEQANQETDVVVNADLDAARPPEPLTIDFAQGVAVLPNDKLGDLADFALWMKAQAAGVRILAGGENTGLSIDRARAVAVRLVTRGVAGDLIDIETGGSGDRVVLYPLANES